jgi:ketopantoate reductase
VVRAGKKCGVATPGHAFLVGMIHALEGKAKKEREQQAAQAHQ